MLKKAIQTRTVKTLKGFLHPMGGARVVYAYFSVFSLFINTLTPLLVSYPYGGVYKAHAEEVEAALQSDEMDRAVAEDENEKDKTDEGADSVKAESSDSKENSQESGQSRSNAEEDKDDASRQEEWQQSVQQPVAEATDSGEVLGAEAENVGESGPAPAFSPEPAEKSIEELNVASDSTYSPNPIPTDVNELPDILDIGASSERVEPSKEEGKVCVDQVDNLLKSNNEDWMDVFDEDGVLIEGAKETRDPVKPGVKYEFPLENRVSVTFRCLPADEDLRKPLRIQRVRVSDLNLPDEVKTDADYAYSITADMEDGTFEYDLTLPKPGWVDAEILSIDREVDEIKKARIVSEEIEVIAPMRLDQDRDRVVARGLNSLSIKIPVYELVLSSRVETKDAALSVTSLPPEENGCLREVANKNLTCTSNDIRLASVTEIKILDDGCAYPGDDVTFTATYNVVSTADKRYDVGLYFSTDSDPNNDGALSGSCTISTLPTTMDLDKDACGDVTSSGSPVSTPITITTKCVDDGTNHLRLPYCSAWDQNAGGVCTSPKDTAPGAPSKCSCEGGFSVPITVPYGAHIEVIKKLSPATDTGRFDLQIDGESRKLNAGDGDSTGKVSVGAGTSNAPGARHTVGEVGGDNTSLDDYIAFISCVDRGYETFNGGAPLTFEGAGPLEVPVDKDDDIKCVITNTLKSPALSIDKTAHPATYSAVGETITYSYTIKNTGNTTLTGHFSVDDDKVTVTCTQPADGALSPNEEMTCGASYTITQADLDSGSVTNIASATNGTITSPTDSETVTAVQSPIVPRLSIAKWNDVVGNEEIGNTVLFTIRVTAHDNSILDVVVTDLFSKGFEYVAGSWKASSNKRGDLKALGIVLEPVYASPADWHLGDMEAGEVVTLSYLAKITNEVDPGVYKDLAWARGAELLAAAEETGYVSERFVGTEVPVVADAPTPEARAKVKTVVEREKVLGAATELPATGSDTMALVAILISLGIGVALVLNGLGVSIKRRALTVLLVSGLLFSLSTGGALAGITPIMSVRLEKPHSPVNGPFKLTFVAMEINGLDMSAKCLKKYSSDANFSQFGPTITVTSGGNTYSCQVDSNVLAGDGTYEFMVEVSAGGATQVSNKESVVYDGGIPGKPKYVEKDKKGDCKYEVVFKTADDGGETSYVEIYRDDDKEFTVGDSKRIKTITIGSNQKSSFIDQLYGSECANTPYYAIRAFNSVGTPSSVRAEEVTKTESAVVEGETTRTTGAIPAAGGQVAEVGEGATGQQVVLPGGEGKEGTTSEGEETPEVLGETEEKGGEGSTAKEIAQTGVSSFLRPALLGLGILGVIIIVYASRKKKS